MDTPIFFPNPISALPEPRFVEPQSNTTAIALGSALKSVTDVANNFRQKEMNVTKANQMADALEREGLTQEANLYRSAAQSYQTNFFATPEENEKFNQSLLNDTLKLLTNKQERELKEQQLAAELQYKEAMIQNMNIDNAMAGQRLSLENRLAGIREQELQEGMSAKQEALLQKEQRNKILGLDATADNIRQQGAQSQRSLDELTSLRETGSLSQEEFARRAAPHIDSINNSKSQLNNIQREIFRIQQIEAPPSQDIQLGIPQITSKQEKIDQVSARANSAFTKNPGLKEYREGDIVITNPNFIRPDTVTVRESTGPQGVTTSRTVESQGTGVRATPPGLPNFSNGATPLLDLR